MGLIRLQRTAMPSGSVIQTVTKETVSEEIVQSTTATDTALTLSITPTKSNSKIFVIASFNAGGVNSSDAAFLSLFRGSTQITAMGGTYTNASGSSAFGCTSLTVLDSPNTASSVTYTVKLNGNNGTNDVKINPNYGGTSPNEKGHLTLMEIAG